MLSSRPSPKTTEPLNPLLLRAVAIALLSALALSAAWFHLNEALWNDEIYTLKYFVDRGLLTVLTDYHVPNNHIFANAGHWLWTRLTGPLDALLDAPWHVRVWSALLSAGAVALTMRAAARSWGARAGWLAGLVLLSSLTFGNFAFQVRGYPLSLLLAAALLGLALRAVAGERIRAAEAGAAALLTAGLLYAIPSNLYYVVALGMLTALGTGWHTAERRVSALWWAGGLAAGAVLTLAVYAPVLDAVLHNEYVEAGQGGTGMAGGQFAQTLAHFTGWRYLLLLPVAAGWWRLAAGRVPDPQRRQLALLLGVVVVPFVLSALRADTPPLRAFLVQLPAFVLALTLGWSAALDAVAGAANRRALLAAGVAICLTGYAYALYEVRDRLRLDFDTLAREQDLNYNYYEFWYAPEREFALFKQRFPGRTLVVETAEPHDIPEYLTHLDIRHVPLDSIMPYFERERTVYVSTRYPKNFIREVEKLTPRWECSYLQPETRYPRVVICQRK
jgi:hypothetical protein